MPETKTIEDTQPANPITRKHMKTTPAPLLFRTSATIGAFALAAMLSVRADLPTINGATISDGSGTGWSFDGTTVTLSGAGPFVLSTDGEELTDDVGIVAEADCAVVFSNLVMDVSAHDNRSPFTVKPGTTTMLTLVGANRLAGGRNKPGMSVESNGVWVATLEIDAADTNQTLTARGGYYGAGIGGRACFSCGIVKISGGTVAATGGNNGAGIGGGGNGEGHGGVVSVLGGVVSARGGSGGSGIGGGFIGWGGTLSVSGGKVTAVGNSGGAGIGGGTGRGGGAVEISGGTVTAIGSGNGSGIGSGRNGGSGGTLAVRPQAQTSISVSAGTNAEDAQPIVGSPFTAEQTNIGGFVAPSAYVHVETMRMLPLAVNGAQISDGSGAGWSFDGTTVTLSGAGPFVLSTDGEELTDSVGIVAEADCAVVFSNLVMNVSAHDYRSPFTVKPGTTTKLTLVGANSLAGGRDKPGMSVE